MKHFSNILSLRLIFVKKTWRATNKEVIWRHQARSCILKSFWLWFLRSYVRHHLRDSHGQILSVLQIEYRIKIRKLWRMMDIICSRLALSVHVNQSSSSCEVMWRKKKEDGEFFKAMMMCYASFVIRHSLFSLLSLLQLFWAEDVDSMFLQLMEEDYTEWVNCIVEFKFIGIIALKTWHCSCHSDVIIICCTHILCQSCLNASWWDVIFIPGFLSTAA